nr:serine/threonine-protein kinase [Frigoriglobus tundricola]
MSRKSSTPGFDTLTRTPLPATGWPPNVPPGEDLPTFRLPARAASSATGTGAPDPLTTTPPPKDDLKLSASAWSADDGDDFPAATRAPRVGETIQGFRLVGELGRGAFARVFLAHQEALADRPVALKVTLRPTREAERLARLQHTNVVPVYSVHDAAPAQLICMPYLGRVTLADLIRAYRVEHPSRLSGRKSTSARAARATAVDSKSASKSATDPKAPPGPARAPVWTWAAAAEPPIVGDPRAVLQVLAQLAAGLGHAHDRGILHLDIKPANVLLADTGEPMLLDFNLSFDAARPDREMVGGTMPYMAVEQLLDMRARGKGAIDRRTDLYSLGVLAFELLTGTVPFPATREQLRDLDRQTAARRQGPPALRPLNPGVTPAVEAIVRKLLAPEPVDRYQSADEVRTDVERHLADLPLWYARERSVRERFGKWRRRNPGVAPGWPPRASSAWRSGSAGPSTVGRRRSRGPRPSAAPGPRARPSIRRGSISCSSTTPAPSARGGGARRSTARRVRAAGRRGLAGAPGRAPADRRGARRPGRRPRGTDGPARRDEVAAGRDPAGIGPAGADRGGVETQRGGAGLLRRHGAGGGGPAGRGSGAGGRRNVCRARGRPRGPRAGPARPVPRRGRGARAGAVRRRDPAPRPRHRSGTRPRGGAVLSGVLPAASGAVPAGPGAASTRPASS